MSPEPDSTSRRFKRWLGVGRPLVADARGNWVPLISVEAALSGGYKAAGGVAPDQVKHAVVAGMGKKLLWKFVGTFALQAVMFCLAAFILRGFLLSKFTKSWDWVFPATMMLMAVVQVYQMWLEVRKARAVHIAEVVTAAGYCPTCAYDITGVQHQPDGCRACPECGSAWRIGEVAEPATVNAK